MSLDLFVVSLKGCRPTFRSKRGRPTIAERTTSKLVEANLRRKPATVFLERFSSESFE